MNIHPRAAECPRRQDARAEQARHLYLVGTRVELIVSGVIVEVCGVDYDDHSFMDETGGWHSFDDAEQVPA